MGETIGNTEATMSIEFLLGLLLAIPLSILGNVLTRKYDDIIAKRSISVRGKKLKTLVEEYKVIKFRFDNPSLQTLIAQREIVEGIFFLIFDVLIMGLLIISHFEHTFRVNFHPKNRVSFTNYGLSCLTRNPITFNGVYPMN